MDIRTEFENLYEKAQQENPQSYALLFNSTPLKTNLSESITLLDEYDDEAVQVAISYIGGLIRSLVLKNCETDFFYSRLWEGIFQNQIIDSEQEKRCALLIAVLSDQIPYEHVEVISMSNQEFSQRKQNLASKAYDVFRTSNRPFAQKTEKASALLNVIESEEDPSDRAVLFAAAIDALLPVESPA